MYPLLIERPRRYEMTARSKLTYSASRRLAAGKATNEEQAAKINYQHDTSSGALAAHHCEWATRSHKTQKSSERILDYHFPKTTDLHVCWTTGSRWQKGMAWLRIQLLHARSVSRETLRYSSLHDILHTSTNPNSAEFLLLKFHTYSNTNTRRVLQVCHG